MMPRPATARSVYSRFNLFQLKQLSERLSDPFASSLLLRQAPREVLQNCAQLVWCRSV